MLSHEVLWSVAGAVGGLVCAIGAGGRDRSKRMALGGWLGAALATVGYELVGALAFPTHQAQLPVSDSPQTRALAHGLLALGAALGSGWAAGAPNGKAAKS